jgi:predicted phosphodiesterase
MIILSGDWHLDDQPENAYRWNVIEQVLHACIQYKLEAIFILGDLVDRKDRHSAAFVNKLITELRKLASRAPVIVLRGNHDTPLRGPAFWEFASHIEGITYISRPQPWYMFDNDNPDLLLLPFTPTPKEDWAKFKLADYKALFMHATVTGARAENGMVMENNNFPIMPRAPNIYSGDVHTPQQVRNITYVGAPHPTKFGDTYPCRALLLNEAFEIALAFPMHSPMKMMLEISHPSQLQNVIVRRGDQVKIRFLCQNPQIAEFGQIEQAIADWAAGANITIAGMEVVVNSESIPILDSEQDPKQILRAFAAQEHISDDLLNAGLELLNEAH